ncbi:MAG: hypothetical protein GX900_01960 [Clostridiaceae bacterium]|nr:hypothetical protein [Clostridiaceae bacterium]
MWTLFSGIELPSEFVLPSLAELEAWAKRFGLREDIIAKLPEWYGLPHDWDILGDLVLRLLRIEDSRAAAEEIIAQTAGLAPDGQAQIPVALAALHYLEICYERVGLEEQVASDGLRRFGKLLENYLLRHKKIGFDRFVWFSKFTSGRLVRLGTLFYEPWALPAELAVRPGFAHLREGDICLFIHIPEDAKLDDEHIDASLQWQAEFFPARGLEVPAVVTRTWLLDPRLGHFLSLDSRLRRFARRFDIVQIEDIPQTEYGFWVFKLPENTELPLEEWPTETSLQRGIHEYFLAGGMLGSATGILR